MSRNLRIWSIRILAPALFLAAAVVLVLILRTTFDDQASSDDALPGAVAVTTVATGVDGAPTAGEPAAGTEPAKPQLYRVQAGDTLTAIAGRFETTVAELQALNPEIDPVALQTGQSIRIR